MFAVVLGVLAIVASLLPGAKVGPGLFPPEGSMRPATWVDRTLFFLGGLAFLVLGLRELLWDR